MLGKASSEEYLDQTVLTHSDNTSRPKSNWNGKNLRKETWNSSE